MPTYFTEMTNDLSPIQRAEKEALTRYMRFLLNHTYNNHNW